MARKEGVPHTAGPAYARIGYLETIEAIKNSPHYKSKLEGPYRGRGVASGFWFNIGWQSSALVNLQSDGTATLVIGSVDVGGTRAAQAMIVAEVLGIDVNRRSPAASPIPTPSDTTT